MEEKGGEKISRTIVTLEISALFFFILVFFSTSSCSIHSCVSVCLASTNVVSTSFRSHCSPINSTLYNSCILVVSASNHHAFSLFI